MKRYAAAVKVADRPCYVMITVKDNGQMAGVQLYDLQAENKSALTVISGITRHRQGNNSIDDLVRFVKRKIAKYNNCVSGQGPGVLLQTDYHASAGAYSTRFPLIKNHPAPPVNYKLANGRTLPRFPLIKNYPTQHLS